MQHSDTSQRTALTSQKHGGNVQKFGGMGIFLAFLCGIFACPTPLLLPQISTPTETQEIADAATEQISNETLAEHNHENMRDIAPQDAVAPDFRTVQERNIPDNSVRETVPDRAVPRDQGKVEKPPTEPRPNDAPPTCIDVDKDGYCANILSGPLNRLDCLDTDPRVFPGQTNFFAVPNKAGTFDYNCNGKEEIRFPQVIQCPTTDGISSCTPVTPGYITAVPKCGVAGMWATGCIPGKIGGLPGCVPDTTTGTSRVQTCH